MTPNLKKGPSQTILSRCTKRESTLSKEGPAVGLRRFRFEAILLAKKRRHCPFLPQLSGAIYVYISVMFVELNLSSFLLKSKKFVPDIHVPLNLDGCGSFKNISSKLGLRPRTLGPSSGGDTSTILNTMSPNTATITNRAMKIPRQFLSLGELTTNSCNKR